MNSEILKSLYPIDKSVSISKGECSLCFCSNIVSDSEENVDESTAGLFIDLSSLLTFCHSHLKQYEQSILQSKEKVFLQSIKIKKIEEEKKDETDEPEKKKSKPTVLALGVEGGFQGGNEKVSFEEKNSLLLLPSGERLEVKNDLPTALSMLIDKIKESKDKSKEEAVQAWIADDDRPVSKFANDLLQLPANGVSVPPSNWTCAVPGCGKKEGLWLNLTDGHIGCGRKLWTGDGGNSHGLQHFEETGYPLAVKLGTINSDVDTIDVHSYSEDGGAMVKDPKLEEHLAHWGIKLSNMQKVEATIAETEIDVNWKLEASVVEKHGKEVSGAHLVGFKNLGNSCYVNSVLQGMLAVPLFSSFYAAHAPSYFASFLASSSSSAASASSSLHLQLCKIASAHVNGETASSGEGIPLRQFKSKIGENHKEFLSSRQQDAVEFYQYLLQLIEREEHKDQLASEKMSGNFSFLLEDKIKAADGSGRVKRSKRKENILLLPIDLKAMSKNYSDFQSYEAKSEEEKKKAEKVYPVVDFSTLLQSLLSPEQIEFQNGFAEKSSRFVTFPPILCVSLRKFYLSETWEPKKLDVKVSPPDLIDLSFLSKENEIKENDEVEWRDEAGAAAADPKSDSVNEDVVQQLAAMGFPETKCRAAAKQSSNNVEVAMEMLLNNTVQEESSSSSTSNLQISEESIVMLMSMGFSMDQAKVALKKTDGNVERATEWIFSHPDYVEEEEQEKGGNDNQQEAAKEEENLPTGNPVYEIVAVVTHLGSSTSSGHYVCHVKKGDKWVLFNDRLVAECEEQPALDLGYIFIYKRKEQ